jgi:hypothetical protein
MNNKREEGPMGGPEISAKEIRRKQEGNDPVNVH